MMLDYLPDRLRVVGRSGSPANSITSRQLKFRRHLAVCVLALLVRETLIIAGRAECGQRSVGVAAADVIPRRVERELQRREDQEQMGGASSESLWQDPLSYLNEDALMGLLERYLPRISLNFSLIGDVGQFENAELDREVENYFEQRFPVNITLDELQLLSIKSILRMNPMPVHTSWGYESAEEQRISSYPVKDSRRCANELAMLAARLDKMMDPNTLGPSSAAETASSSAGQQPPQLINARYSGSPVDNYEAQLMYRSRDILFARYLDAFGRVPSDLLHGNTRWYGSSSICLDTKLLMDANSSPVSETTRTPKRLSNRPIKFRYCMASMRSLTWPPKPAANRSQQSGGQVKSMGVSTSDFNSQNFFYRIGVCLPESCDSSAFEESSESLRNVEKLAKFNLMRPFNSDHYYLDDLYCLPDERSPLRSIPLLGKLFILAALAWLSLIGIATTVDLNVQRFYTFAVGEIRKQQSSSAATNETSNNNSPKSKLKQVNEQEQFKESDLFGLKNKWIRLNVYLWDTCKRLSPNLDIIDCLSLYSNWLRYTRKVKVAISELHAEGQRRERIRVKNQQLVEKARKFGGKLPVLLVNDKKQQQQHEVEMRVEKSLEEKEKELDQKLNDRMDALDELEEEQAEQVKNRVDLSSLNALKVVCMFWIIAGHCILYLPSTTSNGAISRIYTRRISTFLLANGAVYITEIFFIITGCLTAYLAFKYNTISSETASEGESVRKLSLKRRSFKLSFWLVVVLNRYLRIMPTYLVVYTFIKLVSVYVSGSGQIWDYAVSANSFRRRCVEESWLPVLTLTTNYRDLYSHCIIGGWYLSVDAQFLLMAIPLLLVLAYSMKASNGNQIEGNSKQQQQQLTFIQGTKSSATSNEQEVKHEIPVNEAELRLSRAYLLIGLSCALSCLIGIFYYMLQRRVDLTLILKFTPHVMAHLSNNVIMYTSPLIRFRAFALGLILGHLLYLYEFGLIRLPKVIQQHGAKLCVSLFTLGFFFLIIPAIYPKSKLILSHDVLAALVILSCTGIDLFLCALIFLICIGKSPKIILLLVNSPFWSLLSSLSLSAFLIHTEIILILTSTFNPPPSIKYSVLLLTFCAALILTYLLALCLFLAFEMPCSRLVESLARIYLTANSRASSSSVEEQKERSSSSSRRRQPTDQHQSNSALLSVAPASSSKQQ